MYKDDTIYINHILDSIKKIESYTTSLSREEFANNGMIQDAVIRNFEIIGEAAKNISLHMKQPIMKYPGKRLRDERQINPRLHGSGYCCCLENNRKRHPAFETNDFKDNELNLLTCLRPSPPPHFFVNLHQSKNKRLC